MNEIKISLPKHLVIIVVVVIFAITFGGYILFFQSQKRIVQKDREFEMLKEKQMHSEENYNELQKKFDGTSEELKQVNKDYEAILQKNQECKENNDALQTKYDNLIQSNEIIKKELQEAQTKLGIKPEASTQDNSHPVQLLNPPPKTPSDPNSSVGTPTMPAPADNNTPTGGASAPQSANDPTLMKTSAKTSPNTTITITDPTQSSKPSTPKDQYQCPAATVVSQNVTTGNWQQNKMNWWVDFSTRPLNDNETVKSLFQVLYDGKTVACYYQLNGSDPSSVWLVVKGGGKDNKALKTVSNDGWVSCTNQDCQFICKKENIARCHFKLQD